MSLKAFHIFFIAVSILFLIGFAVWSFQGYAETGESSQLIYATLSCIGVVGLIIYGINFLRKVKNLKST